jgi:uncharacterized protein (DUF849 family)
MTRSVAIAVAPNGARRGKADHRALPITPAELARAAAEALEAGASVLHMHVRDAEGRHVLDADLYRDATVQVRRAVGDRLVVQITTEAVGVYSPAEQRRVVEEVRPEAVSVALRELAPEGEERSFFRFLDWARQEGIAVQVILYDRADRDRLLAFAARGDVDAASTGVLYVLGRYAERQLARPSELMPFLDDGASPFPNWMCCAFGAEETRCLALAALLGGDMRTGFENNFTLPDGRIAAGNSDLVAAAARAATALGLGLADAGAVRERWLGR